MRQYTFASFLLACILLLSAQNSFAITPQDVLVVYNTASSIKDASQGTAEYYSLKRGIPSCNILGISTETSESISGTDYVSSIATPIWSVLSQSAYSNIKVIVLCYGIPLRISDTSTGSVDSALMLLGNSDVLSATHWGLNISSPYYESNQNWNTFKDSSANTISRGSNQQPWKINYLVTRIDGYSVPTTTVTICSKSFSIPSDVKNMIDRALRADAAGRTDALTGNCVLDDAPDVPTNLSREYSAQLEENLIGLGVTVDREGSTSETSNIFAMNKSDVMLYSSSMSYDYIAHQETTWWRPCNTWKDGSIAIPWMVSTDGRSFRNPSFVTMNADTQNVDTGALKVYLWPMQGYSTPFNPALYTKHWLGLHAADGTTLGSAFFDSAEQIAVPGVSTQTVPVAKISLSQINWPQDNKTYLAVHFPDDDPLHAGETVIKYPSDTYPTTTIYDARLTGITYGAETTQCLSSELIREGSTATTGNVAEPYAGACADPDAILPSYASGLTWVESAYMGFSCLSWMEVAVGDPLMAPFAQRPSITITAPTTDGSAATGIINIAANATSPSAGIGISHMEVWISSGFRNDGIGTLTNEMVYTADNTASLSFAFDTAVQQSGSAKYPDGIYTIKVIAIDDSANRTYGIASRNIYIRNAGTPTVTATLTNPADSTLITGTTTLTLEASISDPSSVSSVDFWVYGRQSSILVGTDTSANNLLYSTNLITDNFDDGTYNFQAIAHCSDGKIAASDVRSFHIVNRPGITITAPEVETGSFDVTATIDTVAQSLVHGVEFFLFAPGATPQSLGTDSTAPYTWTINPSSYSAGTYMIRAIPHDSNGDPFPNYAQRKVILASSYNVAANIASARLVPDNSSVVLQNLVVSAAGQPSLDTALYVASADRAAGIRVVSNSDVPSLSAGDRITLLGTLHTSSEEEREIVPNSVIRGISTTAPKPMFMTIHNLGGGSPDTYTNGIDDVSGLYNIGQLVRVCGRVNYVGDTFVYVDEGSGGTDSSGLKNYPVPLNGNSIPTDGVDASGVRVYFGTITKPKIGDYVAITGISSCKLINGNHSRYIRATGAADTITSYQSCYVWTGSQFWPFFANANNTHQFQVGEKVRVAAGSVLSNSGNKFTAWCSVLNRSGDLVGVDFNATTALTTADSNLIIMGTIAGIDPLTDFSITPDLIYKGTVGSSGIGVLSVGSSSSTFTRSRQGIYRPWPGLTSEEILASDSFQSQYNQTEAIGWALSQPDGTVLDLQAETVISEYYDCQVLGLKEWFEPLQNNTPKLLLYLEKPVKGLNDKMTAIDIVGATITTLSNGQRALVAPKAVYAYTDQNGQFMLPLPWSKHQQSNTTLRANSLSESSSEDVWPWKLKITP